MKVNNSKYKLLFSILLLAFANCNKRARIEIFNNDIKVQCIFNAGDQNEADIISVRKNGKEKEIFRATNTITNVSIKDKNIIIKLYKPANGIVYTKHLPTTVFDYAIILDSSASYNEYINKPGEHFN